MSCERNYDRPAGARVARSTPDRKVICSNQVWVTKILQFLVAFCHFDSDCIGYKYVFTPMFRR